MASMYSDSPAWSYVNQDPRKLAPIANQMLQNQVLQKSQQESLRSGPSMWRQLMDKQIQKREAAGLDVAQKQAAGALAGGEANLAMHGGLSGGAKERLSRGTQDSLLNMQQDVANQAGSSMLSADIADEQNRISQLGAQQGVELQKNAFGLGANQFDIGQEVAQNDKLNMNNMAKYQDDMAAWAAAKQAEATQRSGGTGWLSKIF
jgi:hypothetical protein